MCNLYSMTRAQDAMRKLFGVKHDRTGNLPWRFLPRSMASKHTYRLRGPRRQPNLTDLGA